MQSVVKWFKMPVISLRRAGCVFVFVTVATKKASIAWRAKEDESMVKFIVAEAHSGTERDKTGSGT